MIKLISVLESIGLMPKMERLRKEYRVFDFLGGVTGNIFLIAVVISFVALALELTIIKSQGREISEYGRLLKELQGDVEGSAGKDSDKKILTDTVSALDNFKNALPGSEEITPIITDIHQVAKDNRLKILDTSFNTGIKKVSIINRHSMSFPIEGSYKSIKKFIYDIESLKHHLVIDKISLRSSSKLKSIISINVEISVYLKADS